MRLASSFCASFAAISFILLAILSIFTIGISGIDSIFTIAIRTIPATIIMGCLGRVIGGLLDSPNNLADSDYHTDVVKALKKLDKHMTLADLNEKLTPIENENNAEIEIQNPDAEGQAPNNEPIE